MELTTTYFETTGRANTDEVLRITRKRAQELGVKTVLVASTSGDTAVKAVEALNGVRIIAVGLSAGWQSPANHAPPRKFTEENRLKIESSGGVVLRATHFLGGLDRAIKAKSPGMSLSSDIVA
ncbi:MAG: pyruvate kinase alpha/beta domain-containing protein, partial [Chloroflexota bacterium]